ncbi:MAG: flagellar basal-body MS-ring/collar protein FliF [Chthoniobacteraceae bacterium]|nr:flagellar basal-body MS-ring/collar protein FliF [Chthoniobacteraceae bacterium]
MNDFIKQMGRLWSQLAISQRITLGLAIAAVIAGMVGVVLWSGRSQMQLLYGRLGEKDIAEVLSLVQEQGVKYEIGAGGGSVYVPGEKVHQLRAQLAAKGVPSGGGVGFEIFDRSNFGISDFVQRTNYVRAVQGELSRTIAQINGVHSARVLIVMPENRLLFSDAKSKPTASVFVEQGAGALTQEAVNSIRFLVANSVEGLGVNDVAVIDSHGNVLTENLKDDPSLGVATAQMKYRKSVEDYFAGKVETMLSKVLGLNNAVVRVSADVDTDSSTTVKEEFDPEKQVVRNEVVTEDSVVTTETDGTNQRPAVGVTSNTPPNANGEGNAKSTGKNSEETRKNKTNTYEINRTTVNAVKNPGSITHLSAAVFIAAKEKPRSQQELDALRKMVANALGIKATGGQDSSQAISLQEVAFEAPAVRKPEFTDVLYNNQDLLRSAVGLGIAAFVILIFLRLLKRTKPYEIPIEILEPNAGELQASGTPVISPEMLNEMIRQKPENVGAALRGWMAAPNNKN